MTNFSFIHTSDLHLDTPFKGITQYNSELSQICKESTFKAYRNIIDTAKQKKVDFVLFAGDIFDSNVRSLSAQSTFFNGLKDLNNSNIRAYIAHGNHDPTNEWSSSFKYPSLCHCFDTNEVETQYFFDTDNNVIANIHGISFKIKEIRENLVQKFSEKNSEVFSIGLLHCNAGSNTDYDPYAPCSLDDLRIKNYDYWALGHIHQHKILQELQPKIVYCGTPQGRSLKESGEHGCYYVEVDNNRITNCEFITTDTIRWFDISVDISNINTLNEMEDLIEHKLNNLKESNYNLEVILLNLLIKGKSDLHKELVEKKDEMIDLINNYCKTESSFPKISIQKIDLLTKSIVNIDDLKNNNTFISDLLKKIQEAKINNELYDQIKSDISPLIQNSNLKHYLDDSLTEPEKIKELLTDVENRCVDLFS